MTGLGAAPAHDGSRRTVAAMQPYLFPYLGYFQLIAHADTFVIGDDFPWVRGGWINRNRFLERGAATMFTLPVVAAAADRSISERLLADGYPEYRRSLLGRLRHAYSRAPQAAEVLPLIGEWLPPAERRLIDVLQTALRGVLEYLDVETPCALSSSRDTAAHNGVTRVVRLVEAFGGTRFLNPPGGRAIYRRDAFEEHGIELAVLDPDLPAYPQAGGDDGFVPALSIIDVLLNVPRDQARALVVGGREAPAD